MTRTIPRLLLVAAGPLPHGRGPTDGPAFAADRAVDVARAATAAGLEVCAVVAGSDRDQPGTERMGRLAEVTGRAVHRVDARLMPTPVLQRIVARVTEGSDLCLIVAPESISDEDPLGAGSSISRPASTRRPCSAPISRPDAKPCPASARPCGVSSASRPGATEVRSCSRRSARRDASAKGSPRVGRECCSLRPWDPAACDSPAPTSMLS